MWSLLLRKAILCILYVLLLYCDVIVLSQRLRMYETFETNDLLKTHRYLSAANHSDVSSRTSVSPTTPLIYKTKTSDDSQYIHGMTYQEHKKIAAASEPHTQYRRHRFNALNAPSVPSWRIARTTEAPATESTTVAEIPHSYFGTTRQPLSFESDGYWPDRYGPRSRVKPTIRVESVVNSAFGQARIETGLKPRNPCCQNDTESRSDPDRGKFRFYNSFSRERGYAPYRAVQLVTTTTTSTTDRPSYRWSDRYSTSQSSNQFHERASRMGLSPSDRVVSVVNENAAEWMTTKSPYRHYTTTWVPRTTKERIYNTAPNSLWNTDRLLEVDVEPNNLPRSGFDGVRGIRPWEDRPVSTSSTTTRRPVTLSGASVDEYDYYDELEKRQTSTTKYPWIVDWRRTTESSSTPRIFTTAEPRASTNDRWILRSASSTSTTPSPYVEYPPGPIYKPYDEDRDFKEWKSQIERKVQRIRRPSGKTKTPANRMRVTGSPSLENDLVPLFKVSGVEEEDWKFIHETNSLEDSFQPQVKHDHDRYRTEWDSDSVWRVDRNKPGHDSVPFGASRRTTRTTAITTTTTSTTEPPSTEPWAEPRSSPRKAEADNATSTPGFFVPPTRRFVPRKPVVVRRRTTPRSRSGPKYSFRLYTPPETASEAPPSTERTPTQPTETSTMGSSPRFSSHRFDSVQHSTEPHNVPAAFALPDMAFMTTPRRPTAPATTPTTSSPDTAYSASTTTISDDSAPPLIPSASSTAASTKTAATLNTETGQPIEVHWLSTRRPVFGEGMSIEEQLAEAMRRLQERRKAKELEKEKIEAEQKRAMRFDGSGDWENEIRNDAPVIVESVPEVADFGLRDDSIMQHVKRVSGNLGGAEIQGELVNEHVMQVDGASKPLKPNAHGSRFL